MNHEFFKHYTHEKLKRYTHQQMSLTYWFVFVYDRTKEDAERVVELNGKYLDRTITAEEKEEWMAGMKGALNSLDLRRIEWNTYLIEDFELLKLSLEAKTDWRRTDIPDTDDFIRILDNVQKIRDSWAVASDTPQTPARPMNTFDKWNDVEKILHDISHTYASSLDGLYYTGTDLYSGEGIGIL